MTCARWGVLIPMMQERLLLSQSTDMNTLEKERRNELAASHLNIGLSSGTALNISSPSPRKGGSGRTRREDELYGRLRRVQREYNQKKEGGGDENEEGGGGTKGI